MVDKQVKFENKRIPIIIVKEQMLFVDKCLSVKVISIAKC